MQIAVYPTSANPPTYGHADILLRTAKQFDHVYWSAAMNTEKNYIFDAEVRKRMMKDCYYLQTKTICKKIFLKILNLFKI